MPYRTLDLTKINEVLDDPAHQDVFKLAERLGKATREHFLGRDFDPYVIIEAAMTCVQAALRDVPPEVRDEVIEEEIIGRIEAFAEFLDGIGRPAEGSA